ncbi:hypothetical protein [Ktedonospora formicarum]|uniref:hypothetical protein n=1 Tax=Ktedonospora formicarum TaxID=2778364 RepID=UPI001C691185|nr:hypothetical protein [Ktedonospora formicarum]
MMPIFWVRTVDQTQQDQPSIIDQNIHAADDPISLSASSVISASMDTTLSLDCE